LAISKDPPIRKTHRSCTRTTATVIEEEKDFISHAIDSPKEGIGKEQTIFGPGCTKKRKGRSNGPRGFFFFFSSSSSLLCFSFVFVLVSRKT